MRSGLLLLARSYSRRRSSLASCAAGPLLSVSRLLLSGWGEWCGFSFLREGLAEGLRDPFPFSTGLLTISGLDRVLAFFPLGSGNRMVCENVCVSNGSMPMDAGPGDLQDLYRGLASQAQVSGGFPRFHEGRLSPVSRHTAE